MAERLALAVPSAEEDAQGFDTRLAKALEHGDEFLPEKETVGRRRSEGQEWIFGRHAFLEPTTPE